MFELTRRADYALRLMIEVGAESGASISTAEAARRQQIPYQFLRKVAGELAAHGLLTAGRGVKGGVSLARPAESITVLDIIRVIDPPAVNQCTVDPSECERRGICAAYPVWHNLQEELESVLASARLSDLVRRHKTIVAARRPGEDGWNRSYRQRPARRSTAKSPEQMVQMARLRRVASGLDSAGSSALQRRNHP